MTDFVVYGTLKSKYHNNYILQHGKAKLIDPFVVLGGFELRYAGFPVAFFNQSTSMSGELWSLPTDDRKLHDETIARLDQLEAVGSMYDRLYLDKLGVYVYVGNQNYWNSFKLQECPKDEAGVYYWERKVL